jgi:hypothetical protein
VKSFKGRISLGFGRRPATKSSFPIRIASDLPDFFEVTPHTTRSSPAQMSTRAGRRFIAERSVKGKETVTIIPGSSRGTRAGSGPPGLVPDVVFGIVPELAEASLRSLQQREELVPEHPIDVFLLAEDEHVPFVLED